MAAQEHQARPRSYAEMLERDYPDERCSWLPQMLRGGYFHTDRTPRCTIHVIDRDNGQTTAKKFDLLGYSDVETDFIEVLEKPVSAKGVRFVVVDYGELCDLNFAYVDFIASTLSLEPSFFFAHFERGRSRYEEPFRDWAPALLPSDLRHLEFIYPDGPGNDYNFGHIAATQSKPFRTEGTVGELYRSRLAMWLLTAFGIY